MIDIRQPGYYRPDSIEEEYVGDQLGMRLYCRIPGTDRQTLSGLVRARQSGAGEALFPGLMLRDSLTASDRLLLGLVRRLHLDDAIILSAKTAKTQRRVNGSV